MIVESGETSLNTASSYLSLLSFLQILILSIKERCKEIGLTITSRTHSIHQKNVSGTDKVSDLIKLTFYKTHGQLNRQSRSRWGTYAKAMGALGGGSYPVQEDGWGVRSLSLRYACHMYSVAPNINAFRLHLLAFRNSGLFSSPVISSGRSWWWQQKGEKVALTDNWSYSLKDYSWLACCPLIFHP